jgi:hypothetical protein
MEGAAIRMRYHCCIDNRSAADYVILAAPESLPSAHYAVRRHGTVTAIDTFLPGADRWRMYEQFQAKR